MALFGALEAGLAARRSLRHSAARRSAADALHQPADALPPVATAIPFDVPPPATRSVAAAAAADGAAAVAEDATANAATADAAIEFPPYLPLDPSLPAWPQLHDRHAGEECLYVGNGPSLNRMDWRFVQASRFRVVFGVNKIYLGFSKFPLRVNYLACTNRRILTREQSLDTFMYGLDDRMVKFFREDRWVVPDGFNAAHNVVPIKSISTCDDFTCKHAEPAPAPPPEQQQSAAAAPPLLDALGHRRVTYVNDSDLCTSACRACFCDPSRAYVEGNTVTYAALQLLYYLGCQRVFLVGVDHSFVQSGEENSAQVLVGDDPNHFEAGYFANQTWDLADLASSERHYRIARERYEADGREILDATDGGKLTVFRRVDWRELLRPRDERLRDAAAAAVAATVASNA